ncbi:hypothetical protein GJ496_006037 [Pomphorhynchus laevis]|nr:hypothetical protein GJ496_006037 [Pomphorhynchus laevis]
MANILDDLSKLLPLSNSLKPTIIAEDFNARYGATISDKLSLLKEYLGSQNLELHIPKEKWSKTRRTYQVSDKPNWLRQFLRQLINFCKLSRNKIELREEYVRYRRLYCQILSDFRKTSVREAEGILLDKAEKAPWLLTRRNCSNEARIPISN